MSRGRQGKQRMHGNPARQLLPPATANSAQLSREAKHEGARDPKRATQSPVVSLDPLAPIIVRSGRPMNSHANADPRRFPPPSTVAGCLRTARARSTARPFGPELLQISVAGPLLLTRTDQVLVPKPIDALYFGHGESARCVRASPRPFKQDCGTDLPEGLLPVQLTEEVESKPSVGPSWWLWDDFLEFRRENPVAYDQIRKNGWSMPLGDLRTHITIDSSTFAAAEGKLFQTEGLDLSASPAHNGVEAGGLRLLARCGEALGEALVHLGGKRRLAILRPETEAIWPQPPEGWFDTIGRAGGLCLTLLTSAVFTSGYRPGWLDRDLTGSLPIEPTLQVRLRAAAVDRWEPHSGWDLAKQRPRASRKLVGSGATYWFQFLGDADSEALSALWLASVSDLEQDRRDGFGLALPSPWTPPD